MCSADYLLRPTVGCRQWDSCSRNQIDDARSSSRSSPEPWWRRWRQLRAFNGYKDALNTESVRKTQSYVRKIHPDKPILRTCKSLFLSALIVSLVTSSSTAKRDDDSISNLISKPSFSQNQKPLLKLSDLFYEEETPASSLSTSSLSNSKSKSKSNLKSSLNGQVPVLPSPLADLERQVGSLRFTRQEYLAEIPENSINRVYVTPDPDLDRMGINLGNDTLGKELSFRFKIKSGDPDKFFKAEAEVVGDFVFLMIRTRSNNDVLNRERRASYDLEILCRVRHTRDKKIRFRLAEPDTKVHVKVTDTNDLDPFFQPSSYTFSVPEDIGLHTSIGQVFAEDADEGVNGEIYYSIQSDKHNLDSPFAVDPITGILSLTRPLDFKKRPRHELKLIARDRGAKSQFATHRDDSASVVVDVQQVK